MTFEKNNYLWAGHFFQLTVGTFEKTLDIATTCQDLENNNNLSVAGTGQGLLRSPET